jgi:hypothetical protein
MTTTSRILAVAALIAAITACSSSPPPVVTPEARQLTTAQQVIAANLDAIGGADRIRAIDTMVITGGTGSAMLTSTEALTLYLARPERFKQQGLFRIVLADGDRLVVNTGREVRELEGSAAQELAYRLGFYHNAFSLLEWEPFFAAAELEGTKRYGPTEQYVLRLPGAENGHDLMAYIDADSLLVDRIVFTIDHPDARRLTIVNRLRDFETFDGVLMPTRLVYDKVGWESSPSHFLIDSVEVNPPLDESIFADATIDWGHLEVAGDAVEGELRGVLDGALLTNIRMEDVSAVGVELGGWLEVRAAGTTLRARLLDNIQASAAEVRPQEVYLCHYPISGFPRLMLMGFGVDVEAALPFEPGDSLVVTPTEKPDPSSE